MKPIYHYTTVSEALTDLKVHGYTRDFNVQSENIKRHPHDYEVDHVYRYEGDSDPGDEAVVYGIHNNAGEKGVFVSGFSANADAEAEIVLQKLCIEGSGQCEI